MVAVRSCENALDSLHSTVHLLNQLLVLLSLSQNHDLRFAQSLPAILVLSLFMIPGLFVLNFLPIIEIIQIGNLVLNLSGPLNSDNRLILYLFLLRHLLAHQFFL